jgi:tRNA threonylcarbamoyladenosine biosynthesis protein TsaE
VIALTAHDPAWAERFAAEERQIRAALGNVVVEIEHVGSTAVPGLAAKPTVDIAVGATTIELPADVVARMEASGYEDAAADSRPGERRFRKGGDFPRDVIVHVVEWGSTGWSSFLRFRDALRRDRELARDYEMLKRALLDERGDWYRGEDKRELIERVLAVVPARAFDLTASAAETEAAGARIATRLEPGDVVTVSGELGSGKTTFVRGACRGLGVVDPVTSPTFTVGHRYRGTGADVSHLDLYRFSGVSSAEWGDLEPYFREAIAFVEWPEAAAGELGPVRASVRLGHVDPAHRAVTVEADEALLATVSEGC